MKYVSSRLKQFKQAQLVMGLSLGLLLIHSSGWFFNSALASPYRSGAARVVQQDPDFRPELPESKGKGKTKPIALPGRIAGSVSSEQAASYEFAYSHNRTGRIEEFFRFTVPPGPAKQVDIMLSFGNPSANLDLFLFQQQLKGLVALAAATGETMTERLTPIITLDPGTYLIGISAVTGSSDYLVETRVASRRLFQLNVGALAADDSVTMPVSFLSEGDENDLTFSLNFNPVVLSHPQVLLSADALGASLGLDTRQVGMGQLGVRIILPSGQKFPAGAREILKVIFLINRGSGIKATTIGFSDQPVVRENFGPAGSMVAASYQEGTLVLVPGLEADVGPHRLGTNDGLITAADWAQIGRFVAGLEFPADGGEFQRADCAPVSTLGDGRLTIADWVVARRYAAGREVPVPAGGPTFLVNKLTGAGGKPALAAVNKPLGPQPSAERLLRVKPDVVRRGQESALDVELQAGGNESAVGFSFRFDPQQLSFVRAEPGSAAEGATLNLNTAEAQDGRIGLALALPLDQTLARGSGQIVRLFFGTPENGTVNATNLELGDSPVAREVVGADSVPLATNFQPGVVTFSPLVDVAPSLTGLTPTRMVVGSPATTLTVNGSNFVNEAVLLVNGEARVTEFISSTQLRATIPATDLARGGQLEITVQNPPFVRSLSNPLKLSVVNPSPVLSNLNPSQVVSGGRNLTISVTGKNFVPNSVVQVNGSDRPTAFVGRTQLNVQLTESDMAAVGTAAVQVINPGPGGGSAGPLTLTVNNPPPVINSLSEAAVAVNSSGVTLTINGTGFRPGSVAHWNGVAQPTTFITANQLITQIQSPDLSKVGAALLAVVTPAPGGGASNARAIAIKQPNPLPTLAGLSPNSIEVGHEDFSVTVNGSDFVPGAVVHWNGSPRPTTYVSPNQLSVQIPASDAVGTGPAAVTVVNQAPGGGFAEPLIFTVYLPNPAPTILNLSLNATPEVGLADQLLALTINGANFINGAVASLNGSPRRTVLISGTLLSVQITPADLAHTGATSVTVTNPEPGGGISNTLNLVLNGRSAQPAPPDCRASSLNPGPIQLSTGSVISSNTSLNELIDQMLLATTEKRTGDLALLFSILGQLRSQAKCFE